MRISDWSSDVCSSDLLLLDEPMSALDKQIRQKTQIELAKILEQVGVTCIMVTHDQEEAMTMAHRLAVMTEGQIVQCGTPQDVYAFPNSLFVAEIGSASCRARGCREVYDLVCGVSFTKKNTNIKRATEI